MSATTTFLPKNGMVRGAWAPCTLSTPVSNRDESIAKFTFWAPSITSTPCRAATAVTASTGMRAVTMLPATVPTRAPSILIESIAEASLTLTKALIIFPLTDGALRIPLIAVRGIRSRMVLVVSLLVICADETAIKATAMIVVIFPFIFIVFV